MAITGPFNRTVTLREPSWFGNPVSYQKSQTWYRQTTPKGQVPRLKPLNYGMTLAHVVSNGNGSNPFTTSDIVDPFTYVEYASGAYNTAYKKFVDDVGEALQLAVDAAERKQAFAMIERRVGTLIRFARKLNRFDFPGAGRELGLFVPPGRRRLNLRRSAKSLGNNWLEFHFGWEPLVKDIFGAVDLLQSPYPAAMQVKGRGRERLKTAFSTDLSSVMQRTVDTGEFQCLVGGRVSVTNPNLFLANQMGLVNPASVAWELVPFSFVIDWFANVGQVLASFSDLIGCDVVDTYVTSKRSFLRVRQNVNKTTGITQKSAVLRSVYLSRSVGPLPRPTLKLKTFKGLSPARGATAIALLLQQLR